MEHLNNSRILPVPLFIAAMLLVIAANALAAVRYVDVNSPNTAPPYTNWTTAATNIQDAVDAAMAGDEIVVTNGIYATGGRPVDGTMTNRVTLDKPLMLRSVNGPQFTIIQGHQAPGTVNGGDGAIRCVYLANGASLSGFTLSNGGTRAVNDYPTFRESAGGGVWCESTNAVVVSNCVVEGNSAYANGGGSYGGTLNNCTLTGNSTVDGGGASYCTLNNCTLTGNSADVYHGGGASYSTLNNCTLSGNFARDDGWGDGGGGASGCTLNTCILTDNSSRSSGGAASDSSLNNCALTGNSASSGGGAYHSMLNGCTLSGNSGGGAYDSALNNCIVYFNTAEQGVNYDSSSTLNYCCTTPLPTNGVGNISLDPQLASAWRLSAGSPCRTTGNAAYASGTDIDGELWATPPSIGCDEYQAGALTGPLSVGIAASFTNVLVGFMVEFTALIEGRTVANSWDFGDGIAATNQPYTSHSWAGLGDYSVVLRAYNESQPDGISATVTVHVVAQPVHYVAAESANPATPYTSWASAATNLQDAVDAATVAGALLLVTNGIYDSVGVGKPLTLRSLNGPQFTTIDGSHSGRCVYLTIGAKLSGFTLTNGTSDYGGGAYGGTLNNCTLSGNSAVGNDFGGSGFGGGAYDCTLNNCTLEGNSSQGASFFGNGDIGVGYGGGACGCTLNNCTLIGNGAWGDGHWNGGFGGAAYDSALNNCTLVGNWAQAGTIAGGEGGALLCTLNNCVVYFNTEGAGTNYNYNYSTLSYCCTTPQPAFGLGNITNAPLFVGTNGGWANLRLQSNSPCINAGRNAFAPLELDLDGNPRIQGGTVDIGAYEFQSPTSMISYAWLRQYGLPTDGSADAADPDGDGLTNWQEWRCGTDPTNALSALRLLAPANGGTNVTVTWHSVAGVNYFLERGTNLAGLPAFTLLATGISGEQGTTSFTDTNAIGAEPWFYRVGVSSP